MACTVSEMGIHTVQEITLDYNDHNLLTTINNHKENSTSTGKGISYCMADQVMDRFTSQISTP